MFTALVVCNREVYTRVERFNLRGIPKGRVHTLGRMALKSYRHSAELKN